MGKRKIRDEISDLEFLETVKRTTIIGIFSDDFMLDQLVLKGGNAIDLVYDVSTRASLDIDLSMSSEFQEELKQVETRLLVSIGKAFQEIGFFVFDFTMTEVPQHVTEDLKSFWGGYTVEFKLIEKGLYDEMHLDIEKLRRNSQTIGLGRNRKFCIDISKHEYCEGKQLKLFRNLTIYVYSPEMIVCEKLRAICQQMEAYTRVVKKHRAYRARDFFDIHSLTERFSLTPSSESLKKTLIGTFAAKRVPLELLAQIENEREQHKADFVSVKDTLRDRTSLQSFDFYFDFVLNFVRKLEPLWNE